MKYLVSITLVAVLGGIAYLYGFSLLVASKDAGNVMRLVHDFQVLEPLSVTTREVPIVNPSTRSWSVESIQSACSCTVQELEPKTIAPGQSGRLKVTFRASEITGPFSRDILVRFKEPDAPLTIVGLRGTVRRWAEPRPAIIECGAIAPGANTHVQFEIVEYESAGTRLSKTGPDWVLLGPQNKIGTTSDTPSAAVSASSLLVRPPGDLPPGPFKGIVTVADLGSDRTIDVSFRGQVVAPIKAEPDQIFIGFVKSGSSIERTVRLKVFANLAGISASSLELKHSMGDELSVAVRSTETPGEFELYATYKALASIGPRIGSVDIVVKETTVFTLPVRAFVRESHHD